MYYHVWFVTKRRRPVLVGEMENKIKHILNECIERHNYKVEEFETNIDHVHMLVDVGSRQELANLVRTVKSVSAMNIHATPRSRVGNIRRYYRRKPVVEKSSFWARRYGWKEIDKNEIEIVRNYIRSQKQFVCGDSKEALNG